MKTLVRFTFMLVFAVTLFIVGNDHTLARGFSHSSSYHVSSYHVSNRSYSSVSNHRSSVFHSHNKAYSVKHIKIIGYKHSIVKVPSVKHSTSTIHRSKSYSVKHNTIKHISFKSHSIIKHSSTHKIAAIKHYSVKRSTTKQYKIKSVKRSVSLKRLFKAPSRHVMSNKVKSIHIGKHTNTKHITKVHSVHKTGHKIIKHSSVIRSHVVMHKTKVRSGKHKHVVINTM